MMLDNRLERFQVEARFMKPYNGNNLAQNVQWTDAVLRGNCVSKISINDT